MKFKVAELGSYLVSEEPASLRLPAMRPREILSSVAKNLNSIKHFVNLHMKGSSDILSNLALHHTSQFRCRQP